MTNTTILCEALKKAKPYITPNDYRNISKRLSFTYNHVYLVAVCERHNAQIAEAILDIAEKRIKKASKIKNQQHEK